jgi:hypothetical protein
MKVSMIEDGRSSITAEFTGLHQQCRDAGAAIEGEGD